MLKKTYKKKYINIVIDASRNRSGGAIIYLRNFLKHLNIKDTKIKKIIIFSHKNILKQISDRPFLIKCSHPLLEMNIFFQIIWQLIFLPIYLKKNKIDILYSADSSTFCNYSQSVVFNQDILSFDKQALKQTPFSLEKIRSYLIKFLQIRSLNNANEIIFLSKYSKNIISKNLKKKINYNIIYHGIDKNIIKLGEKNCDNYLWDYHSKSKIKIVYVSPLFLYKNHDTVVKAYSRLKKKYNNLDIKFIGSYRHNLKLFNKIINENSLIDKSHFIGEINQKDVIKNLIKSDIFVFASSAETFGISLLEAMAMGMPIVCSNKSSLPEILQKGGLYFNPKNDLQLSNQIESLIRDQTLRKNKSKLARNIALKFSWEENTKKFCKIINKLTK
jgi:glycosyltransferase involved in cell wall biosynthesis